MQLPDLLQQGFVTAVCSICRGYRNLCWWERGKPSAYGNDHGTSTANAGLLLPTRMSYTLLRTSTVKASRSHRLFTLASKAITHHHAMTALVGSRAAPVSSITGQFAQINLSQAAPTPEDYAKYDFQLPHERYVGLLKCQLDPNARELETLVVRCEKHKEPLVARSNGKEKGKNKVGKTTPLAQELYEIELLDTVLFPEGKSTWQPENESYRH